MVSPTEYYKYDGVFYRRLQLNGEWKWYKRTQTYNLRFHRYVDNWDPILLDEELEKNCLRQKKLDRIIGDDDNS